MLKALIAIFIEGENKVGLKWVTVITFSIGLLYPS